MKVRFDRDGCIGCGACAQICSEFWSMSNSKSDLKGGKQMDGDDWFERDISKADLDCNKAAAEACPADVIHIVEEET